MSSDPVTLITTVGFPIAAYLLIYLDLRKKIEELTRAIQELKVSWGQKAVAG